MLLKKLGLAAAVLLVSSAPAWAEISCGSIPFEPAMPTAADMASKSAADAETALHDAFQDIKHWQGDLKTYRDCTDKVGSQTQGAIASLDKVKDADKIKDLQSQKQEADHLFNQSIDREEKVVNMFHAAQTAYCMRSDSDKSKCPKQ
ncbi:MAG TPA: hypothetical protein VGF56_10625 [Rhizomicrobium sp.]|jgi:hypothetical protein